MSTANFDPGDRYDSRHPDFSRVRLMARSGGYVMVRKPHCMPFVLSEKEWARLPLYEEGKAAADQYRAALAQSKGPDQ